MIRRLVAGAISRLSFIQNMRVEHDMSKNPMILTSPPSWLTTAEIVRDLLVWGNLDIFGERHKMSTAEKRALTLVTFGLRAATGFIILVMLLLVFLVMIESVFAALVTSVLLFVGGPLVMITTLWLAFKTMLPAEEQGS